MRDRLLTTKEVGERMGFKSRTISRWCREGKLKGIKIGRVWRVRERDVGST